MPSLVSTSFPSQDLEEFMASSGAHGVIYFSIGSIAESADIPIRAKVHKFNCILHREV
jgi:hypothetical protein